jgi:hypothetical protein
MPVLNILTYLPIRSSFRSSDKSSVPEIYDLDVGDVNDRVAASLSEY